MRRSEWIRSQGQVVAHFGEIELRWDELAADGATFWVHQYGCIKLDRKGYWLVIVRGEVEADFLTESEAVQTLWNMATQGK